MKLQIQKIYPDAKIPINGYQGDAGLDLYTYGNFTIKPGERVSIPTGIKIAIPGGCVGLVWDKSGLAFKGGLKSMGGVIDSGFRGEIQVCLINLGQTDYTLHKGDKIAQMIIQPFLSMDIQEGDISDDTHRGDRGFGSSGK